MNCAAGLTTVRGAVRRVLVIVSLLAQVASALVKSRNIVKNSVVNRNVRPMRFLPVFFDVASGTIALIGDGPEARNKLRLLRAAAHMCAGMSARRSRVRHGQGGDERRRASRAADRHRRVRSEACGFFGAQRGRKRRRQRDRRSRRSSGRAPPMFRSTWSIAPTCRASFFLPSSIAATLWSRSAPAARRLFWRAGYRERIEALLPARIGDLAALMGRFRQRFAHRPVCRALVAAFLGAGDDGPIGAAALAGRLPEAEAALARAVGDFATPEESSGLVYLVGTGPGDPDLLTLRALQALQSADVILCDELVSPAILDRGRRDAERVFVGKQRGRPGIGQDAINRLLVEHVRRGLTIVRLKGGDPLIFGRGGEELDYLRQAGVPAVVVPGVGRRRRSAAPPKPGCR